MLDKSVPYAGFTMRREAGKPNPNFLLPEGYRYVLFTDGDETSWAKIETSVHEYESEFAALLNFSKNFMPFKNELICRCIFIENAATDKIATSMAWWRMIGDERRAWLHWVAVMPEYQGLGLGKAIVSEAVRLLVELEGNVDLYLSTQTWSHKAVGIYKLHGFEPFYEKVLYDKKGDDYKKAMRVLKKLAPR